ncbi:MAG: RHS repeat-associated core domain-containing protein, partial [Balneolales bacterium]|nr:RHS repeat-associated core domain-containing protein [Balneolales bacterium]
DVHYTGEAVLFSGAGSVAMCGTISNYVWRVRNGGFGPWTQVSTSPTYWHTFTNQGTSWQVQLQVHNTVGRTHTRTITGIQVSNAPESQYYLTDHLGSVRAVVNRDGDLLSWTDYYPFGLPMPTRSGNTSNAHDMIKFTGYEAEDEGDLGWYHAEARTYDPYIGRFTSVDPMAHLYPGHTPYHYVLNNPLIFIDPTGMTVDFFKNFVTGDVIWLQNETAEVVTFENGLDGNSGAEMYRNIGTQYYDWATETLYYQTTGPALSAEGSSVRGHQELHAEYVPHSLATGAIESTNLILDIAASALAGPARLAAKTSTSVIKGVTQHATDQAVTRVFKTADILKIVREGTPIQATGRYGAQTRYTLGGNTAVVNSQGKVVTVFSNAPGTAKGLGKGQFIPFD